MKTKFFKIASLTVTLTMILTPFATRVSATPVTDDPVPNVLPNWAQPPPPEPKATAPLPKPSQPAFGYGRAETALTTQALTASPNQTDTTQPPFSIPVRLQRATFDPLLETPDLPSDLTLTAYSGDGPGYYLVQFRGPILPKWKKALRQTGAVIHDYVSWFAYVVRMDEATADRVRALDAVRWVGLYQPAFRLSTGLDDLIAGAGPGEMARIVVRSFTGEPANALTRQLESVGARIYTRGNDSGGGTIFQLELPAASIPAVASLGGVAWVEPWAEPRLTNEIARSPLAFNKDGVEERLGLYGVDQIVVVGDTGVSTGDEATVHQDLRGRVYTGTWGSGDCGTWEDEDGHGTHVSGSVLGSGVMDGAVTSTHSYAGTNAGIAPEALLWAWAFCSNWTGLPDSDPYNDYYSVMYDNDPRVRTNTNSWSYDLVPAGTYNAFSRETDRFIWDHPDMVVLFSAANDGVDADADGIVDQDSMGVPSGSKNIITIGASENYRMSGGYNPGGACDAWGNCWPADFPADPVNSDRLSDDPSGMVAFSSRGPVDDGRLKPDLVAPGSNIVSIRDDSTTGWGVYDANYIYMGGTSMATPLSAGASAIVREFYSVTYSITPTAALVKATLINGAYDMTPGQYRDEVPDGSKDDVLRRPDIHQGWGRIDLLNSLVYDAPRTLWFHEDGTGLNTGEEYSVTLTIKHDMDPFRVTLVWADYPGLEATDGALINDLDLEIVAPNGKTFYGNDTIDDGLLDGDVDHTNNVEGVDLNPLIGAHTIRVKGYNTPQGPQPFALLVSGDMGETNGIVYDGTTLRGIKGARIEATIQPTNTTSVRASGTGGYFGMPAASGAYSVTAMAYGYQPNTVTATVPTSDQVEIPLAPAASYTVEGTVTDANTGYPVRARITVEGNPFDPPPPDGETWSDPTTGTYSLTLASDVAYTFLIEALGYNPAARGVGPLTGDATEDFALTVDPVACTAPGYRIIGLGEDFENGVPPAGWSVVDNAGNGVVWTTVAGSGESANYSGGSGNAASASSDIASTIDYDTELRTPILDVAALPTTTLRYLANYQNLSGYDYLTVGVSVDGGPWQTVLSWNEDHGTFRGTPGEAVALDLSTQLAGATDFQISWRYYDPTTSPDWDWYTQIDAVRMGSCQVTTSAAILEPGHIQAEGCPCTPQIHELTFVNHTGLTDTVNITYTTSPSVTVLDIPADLGVVPDGGVRPLEAVIKIDGDAPPGTLVTVTITATLQSAPAYSATAIIEKTATTWRFDGAWANQPSGGTNTGAQWAAWGATDHIYAIAGYNNTLAQLITTTRYYDEGVGHWVDTGNTVITPVMGPAGDGIVVGNEIWLIGGHDAAFNGFASTQYYSTSTGAWTAIPGAPPWAARGGAFGGTANGNLYIMAGYDAAAGVTYSDTWEFVSGAGWNPVPMDNFPYAGGIPPGPIYGCSVSMNWNSTDYIYVGGEYFGAKDFWRFDPLQPPGSQWTQLANIPANAGSASQGCVAKEGKIYLHGGDPTGLWGGDQVGTLWAYDPGADAWDGPFLQTLNTPRVGFGAVLFEDALWAYAGSDGNTIDPITTERLPQFFCPDCDCHLELEKEGPPWVYPGDRATYLIRLVNTGELNASTTLTDQLPAGVDYAGDLACGGLNCWYDGGDDAVYFDDQIPFYEAITITFDFTATAPISTWVVNTATVAYCGGDLMDGHEFHVHRPPAFTWTKQVAINGGSWQDYGDGPFQVAVDDFVQISETLTYTSTFPHFATVTEDWTGYPLVLQSQAHTDGVVGWLPGGEYGWGLTLSPGASAWLSKTFQVTDTAALITITEWLLPADMPGEQRDVELAVSLPEPAWEKQVWVNGLLTATWPFAGPITVVPSDTVDIVERVHITYTNDVTFTLNEEWSDSLELTAANVSAGLVNWSPQGPAEWVAGSVPPNIWHVLTKTFHVSSTGWLYDYVTETLTVEDADPQLDERVITFQHGTVCVPVSIDDLQSDDPVTLGDTMHFTAAVSGDTPITYTWDFGDGSPEQSGAGISTTAHIYTADSTYTVTLDVENGCPSTDTTSINVTVNPLPTYYTLTVATDGTGTGTVTPTLGTHTYISGATVWLTSTAGTGSTFAGWSGSATGMTNPISITMDGDKEVTATFTLNTHSLTVATDGTGTGSVTPPVGPHSYDYGTTVWLTVTADTGSTFAGWSGSATGMANPISVTMDGDKTITATFTLNTYTLTVATDGTGTGSVTPPAGTHSYDYGATVWLTSTASTGSTFAGWSGSATGMTNPVSVTIDGDETITATFNLNTYTLTVTTDGTGTGSVTPPAGPHSYDYGATVWLTATADTGSTFAGWSGSATGMTNPISVTMDGDKTITATFDLLTYTLTITAVGPGTTNPTPGDYTFSFGTPVVITATADPDAFFLGWSGGLIGNANPETILIDGDKVVTATFSTETVYTLTVAMDGTGSGTVEPPVGTHGYISGTMVWLTATAGTGSTFAGWSGSTTGMANPISVTMDSDEAVAATFTLNTHTLTVATDGTGTGSVAPPVGPHSYDYGTTVWLTATAGTGTTFAGWSGSATGMTNPISVTMDGDKIVTATFNLIPVTYYSLTVATDGTGTGIVTPSVGSYSYISGATVWLTATADTGSTFAGWSGSATGMANPISITMGGDKAVTATFTLIPVTYYTLTVATDGTGTGIVTPSVGSYSYVSGATVWLTATAGTGSTFTGWSGSATGMTNPISITMGGDKEITATFNLIPVTTYSLTVATNGTGTGIVTPSVGSYSYISGTTVWLTATADTGSTFAGWSGSATGMANPVSVTMDGDKTFTATFNLIPVTTYSLAVATDGTGTGIVTPSVGSYSYVSGTTVWLTATADTGSTFAGWSGDASGTTSPVSVTMDDHKAITATFAAQSCIDLATITITGSFTGTPGIFTFTTSYAPAGATPPIAYLWDNGDTASTTIRRLSAGTTTLMITATNCTAALVTDDHTIVLTAYIYLPLIMRSH